MPIGTAVQVSNKLGYDRYFDAVGRRTCKRFRFR
jgi:hypothetical protein